MFLSIVTLFFLGVFTLFYLSKALGAKSQALAQAVSRITDNLDHLAFWGVIYGLAAAVLSPLLVKGNLLLLFVSLVANITIVILALPFAFEKMIAKRAGTMNSAILDTLRELVAGITAKEKILGYVGGGVLFVLLAIVLS